MDDLEQGASGTTEPQGAEGAEPSAAEPSKPINQQAKELPWVQELMQSKAELDQLKAAQAEAKQKAEREKAESEGNYTKALEMESNKRKEIESKYSKEIRDLTLKSELVSAGFRKESLKLFADQFNPEEGSAEEFVSKLKESEANAWLLVDQKATRQPSDGTPASGIGGGSDYDPSWIKSDDPKKRAIAIQKNRERIFGKGRSQ